MTTSFKKNGIISASGLSKPADVYNGAYSNGALGNSVGNRVINASGYTNFSFSQAKPSGNTWHRWYASNFTHTAGATYLYRMSVRCNKCTAGASITMRAARLTNDYFGCSGATIVSSSLSDGKWHDYVLYQVVPASFTSGSSTLTCSPCLEMYTSNLASASTDTIEMDFDVMNVEVLKSSTFVPIDSIYDGKAAPSAGNTYIGMCDIVEY